MSERRRKKSSEPVREFREEFRPKTKGQEEYVRCMVENIVTFGIGMAGTGKSACAIGLAAEYLLSGKVQRIIITRPCVEAAPKSLGALPGGLQEKVSPYLVPAIEHLQKFLGKNKFGDEKNRGNIIIEPLEFMRGRTFDNAFIIGEEFQNATTDQIKMLITRIGRDSKIVINGDIEQADIKHFNSEYLTDLEYVITKVSNNDLDFFGVVELTEQDIVRHKIIGPFLRIFRK